MATINLDYIGKCPAVDPHVHFAVMVNGALRARFVEILSDLLTAPVDRDDAEAVARMLLQLACREWVAANPGVNKAALTGPQLISLRDFVESKVWVI